MGTIKNRVQLVGNVGKEPIIKNLESGRKVARFSLATNESYKDNKGEKQTDTNWHNIVAWGKTADIIEKYGSIYIKVPNPPQDFSISEDFPHAQRVAV